VTTLRRENVRKRYLAHVAALNLGLVMRTLFGHGTPRQAASAALAALVARWLQLVEMILTLGKCSHGMLLPPPTGHPDEEALAA
jgi:hypothetical protein